MSRLDAAARATLERRVAELSPEKRRLLQSRLRSEGLGRTASRSVPRRSGERDRSYPHGPYPLTWGMQRLWFVDRLAPGSTAYNIPFAGRLRGEIDPGTLAAAFREVVRRHEVLRTRFADEAGRPVQLIDPPPARFHLPVIDLSGIVGSAAEPGLDGLAVRERESARLVDGDPQVPFNLATGPVLRVTLVHLAGAEESEAPLHDLLVTMPHIVTDAWSMAVLFRELPPLYDALHHGEPSPLAPLPVQVADYALWQRDWLDGPLIEAEMDFWRGYLEGAPVILELPTDRPRPPVQNLRGRRYYLDLTPAEFARVKGLAEAENATVFMVLLAVFNLVLMRWTGQRDQLLGTPIATRSQPESHGLIGFFIDNAVVRTDLGGDPPFRELVARVKAASLATFAHGDLPFDKVVEAVGVERDLSRPPLIQQIFVYQNVHIPEPDFDGIELVSSQQTDARSARFELTLGMFDRQGGLRGGFEYAEALFDRSTMARMAEHYRNLLLDGLAHPGRRLSELVALGEAERQQVLWSGNRVPPATAALVGDSGGGVTVDGRIRAAAAIRPEAVAVADGGGGEVTYGELVAAGDRLAARLVTLGVAVEEPVAVLAERSPELAVAAFGVLAAGAVYMPLDASLPAARLASLVADAGARVVVTAGLREGAAEGVAALPEGVRVLDALVGPETEAEAGDPRLAQGAVGAGPEAAARLAALVYTSGSTGRPKGVAVTHGGLVNLMELARRDYDLRPGDRVAQILAVGFDAANLEMLPALLAGARLEPMERHAVLGGPALVGELARRRVTVLVAVPSLLGSLPESAPRQLPELRLLVSGGEALPPALAARWADAGEGRRRRLINSYGPTEASVVACQWEVAGAEDGLGEGSAAEGGASFPPALPAASLPIGPPVAGVRAYVVDGEGRPAPLGVPGELVLGGVGLARGYHRRPAATAAAFVPHPWAVDGGSQGESAPGSGPGSRLYRTGDLVRRLPAPADADPASASAPTAGFEYLGRLDGQVKVRGQRIELGEVEAALSAQPGVAAAAVALRADPAGRHRLVAYIVAGSGAATGGRGGYGPDEGGGSAGRASADAMAGDRADDALRAALAATLPEAMLPNAFVHLAELPRLASGKLDRVALPEPQWRGSAGGEPRTAMERTLAAVWRDLLAVDSVGPDDDFFALGGDSIASIQMISRAAAAGVRLTPQQVFGHPTLAGLAQVAEEAAAEGGAVADVPPESGPLELLPIQRWFFGHGLEQPHHWNMSVVLRGTEPLAPEPLAAALAALAERHEALRTVFRSGPDGGPATPHATALPSAGRPPHLPRVDLAGLAPGRSGAERSRVASRHQRGIDLAASPWSPLLFPDRRGDRLLLTVHHLVVDAVSWRVLLEDLEVGYRQASGGLPVRLPPPPTSLQEWAGRLADWASGSEAAEARRQRLAEVAGWQGVGGFQAGPEGGEESLYPAGPEGAAATFTVTLSEDETAALQDAAGAWGAEVEHLLLTSLVEATTPWTGERALAVDLESHGRRVPLPGVDLSRTVGWLTAFEPVLFDLRRVPDGSPSAAVAVVADSVRRARGLEWPFSLLRWSAESPAEPLPVSRRPVSFNYLGRVDSMLGAAGLFAPEPEPPRPLRGPRNRRPHALEVGGWLRGGRLTVTLSHDRDRSAEATALADRLRRSLLALATAGAAGEGSAGEGRVVRELPLSAAQQRLWFLDRLEPGNPAYNVSAPTRLEGRLDLAALRRALDGVARRHEALRTTFPSGTFDGGEARPVQRVHVPRPVPMPRVDLSGLAATLDGARLEGEERRLLRGRSAQPFDLAGGPLLRTLLLDLGPGREAGLDSGLDSGRWDLHLGMHHIVADGWSVSLVVREVAELYAAFTTGRRPDLPEPRLQVGDVALAERRSAADGADPHADQLAYWRRRLDGLPPAVDLPTDRPRPPVVTYRGGETGRTLAPDLADGVRRLAREAGASPFMVFLAALEVLVGRLAGQRDFAIGSPIAGRGGEDEQATVGLFLNHLVLRSDLSPADRGAPAADTFSALLSRVRGTAFAAFAHAEVPFELVVEAVAPRRDLSRTPLFQVFLNMLNFPAPEAELPGLRLQPLASSKARAMFDWTVYVKEVGVQGGGTAGERTFHLELLYNADLFDEVTAAGALAQLAGLLEQAVADPGRALADLSLLTPDARRLLPDPTRPLDDSWPGTVTAAVERYADATPNRPALVSLAEPAPAGRGIGEAAERDRRPAVFTYGDLARAVLGLHRMLTEAGVRRGDRVAIHAHREASLIAAVLACHRAGAAVLLLDPAHPAARNAAMLEVAAPPVLLTLAGGGEPAGEILAATRAGQRVRVAPLADLLSSDYSTAPPPVPVTADDAAVLTFTSGSTGIPKGVLGLHRSLTHFLPWQAEYFGLGADDRFSLLSGLAHDPLQREIFTALWVGATLTLPDPEEIQRPGRLAGWMAAAEVTVAHLTPAMAQLACEVPAGAVDAALPTLRRVFYLGDALTRATADRFAALAPRSSAVSLYGSTETQRAVAFQPIPSPATGDGERSAGVVALGRGMPDAQLLVRRPAGGPCGVGEVGEIHLRSPHLAAGYLHRPAATAEGFLPDPAAVPPNAGGRVYRTGDLGRYRRDGAVESLGRADRQVKVRGFRIEPGEVEAALESHPAVARAAVLARGDGADRRLVAWWVAHPGGSHPDGEASAQELRTFLAGRLPAAMVPASFVRLDAFPLTPNRKLDRAALPDPPRAVSTAAVPPASATERALAAIWQRVLAGDSGGPARGAGGGAAAEATVGREDDFFALGGHSLKLVQVLARVTSEIGVDLPVRTVFEHSTLAGMAAAIDAALVAGTATATALPPLTPVRRDLPLPVSFAQQRLVFLDRLSPGDSAYNVPAGLDFRGPLDIAALRSAFAALVRRHEALRTTFGEVGGELVQVIAAASAPPLPRIDLATLPELRRQAEASRLARQAVTAAFDLRRGPLLRLRLLHLGLPNLGPSHPGPGDSPARLRHRLLLILHHAVTDGWSMGLLLGEAARLYNAATGGAPAALPPLPVQYADFAAWQREWLHGAVLERQLDFWRRQLAGVEALDLPTDRPRGEGRGHGGRLPFTLGADLHRGLEALAAERSVTPFVVLLAVFEALLARYSGQARFAVGTAVANRRHPALEGVVGFFANTLALPATVAGDPTFATALTAARGAHLDALAHQDLPFERLVAALGPFRDPTRPPLAQVILVLHNTPAPQVTGPQPVGASPGQPGERPWASAGSGAARVEYAPVGLEAGASRLELALSFAPGPGDPTLRALLEYDEALFDRATAERLSRHFTTLLTSALATPQRRLSELALLTAAERDHLMALAVGSVAGRSVSSLHGPVLAQAARAPRSVAVIDGGLKWTYGELVDRALAVTAELRTAGLDQRSRERRVGILLPRSAAQVAAVLGVLAAGAAWVPLDPTWPTERLAAMAADADLAALVHGGSSPADAGLAREVLQRAGRRVPVLELPMAVAPSKAGSISAPRPELAVAPPTPDALAYVFYTSGSSGRPKGVMVSHGDAARRVADAVVRLGLDGDGVLLQVISPSFDPWVKEIFATLSTGGRLVIASGAARLDGAVLARELAASGATTLVAAPGLLAGTPSQGLDALRVVAVGGEPCPPEVARRWANAVDPAKAGNIGRPRRFLNFYGPTEATIFATVGEGPGEGDAGPPIGRPAAGTRVHVISAMGPAPAAEPQPPGVAGELVLGGTGLARGYLGRPAATALVFVPDPWGPPGSRLYRTGDRALRTAGGELRLLGRLDRQVKVRGHRVELAEVEAVLAAHPRVREAVVLAWIGGAGAAEGGAAEGGAAKSGADRLVAWVVGEDGEVPSTVLADHVTERLPPFMVPSQILWLEELPRTLSGKVDRQALVRRGLPATPPGVADAGGEHVPPRTPSEERLANLWAEVLEVERVGAEDDFFVLGGHSVAALRLASRLRGETGVELPLAELFAEPTLAAAARALDRAEARRAGGDGVVAPPPLAPLGPGSRRGPLPASFAQERLWFLDRLHPGGSAYNVPAAVWLNGELDVAALSGALAEIVRRHEVLRTTFEEHGGRPMQRIAPPPRRPPHPAAWRLPRVDLSSLPSEVQPGTAEALARRLGRTPFDLRRGPLLRPALVWLASEPGQPRSLLSLTLHHAVCDEWSLAIFLRELNILYRTLARPRQPGAPVPDLPLPALPVQYADYAAWQRSWLDGAALEARLEPWREVLRDVPPGTALPVDHGTIRGDAAVPSAAGGRVRLQPSLSTAEGVRALARHLGATPFQVVLAALFAQLGRYGNADAIVGTPVANRGPRDTEGLIGFFVNTLPLRARPRLALPFAELVEQVRRASLHALAHAEVPFERIVAATASAASTGPAAQRDRGAAPLVRVMLAFHNVAVPELDFPGVEPAPVALDNGGAKMDLLFQVGEGRDGLGGTLEYRADLFEPATAERIAGHFGRLLAAAVERPGASLGELPLLSAAERRQLVGRPPGADAETGQVQAADTLPDLFAAAVSRQPRSVALVSGGRSWTYGELALRASRLANHLRRLGVGPESRVGLRLAPGVEAVSALLGILGAGGAYVPIDPEWPEARAAYVLADAGCRLLVSDGPAPRVGEDGAGEDGAGEKRTGTLRVVRPAEAATASPVPPPRLADPDHLAYVIYTSGSTGRPKGVGVSHRNVVRLLTACTTLAPDASDVWTLFHSLAFDFSVWELWGALAHGGRLVVVPRDVARSPAVFLDLLASEKVTILNQTPSAFAQLAREAAARGVELPALRQVILGGEALAPASLAGWFEGHGDHRPRLVNMYGITETTVHVTERLLATSDAAARGRGGAAQGAVSPIGSPLTDLCTYVVDPALRPVPVGVAGELLVGGAGLARGYLGRPALTAQRFVPDPFADAGEAGSRLYRSGDRALWGIDGELHYAGRLDQQVQVRGFRVEPGEVAAALAALPAVSAAAVVAREDLAGGPGLVGYVVAVAGLATAGLTADHAELAEDRLKAALRRRLPEYMVPARLESLEALPLTVNGKVDREALRQRPLAGAGRTLAAAYEAPVGPVEEVVAGAWAEALGIERVGRHDGFFDLGGHSLLATRMVSWARDAFGVELPLAGLFAEPTVADMAAALVAGETAAEVRRSADLMLELATLDEAEVVAERQAVGAGVGVGAGADAEGRDTPERGG